MGGRRVIKSTYNSTLYIFNQEDCRVYSFITNDLTYVFPFSEFEVPLNE